LSYIASYKYSDCKDTKHSQKPQIGMVELIQSELLLKS